MLGIKPGLAKCKVNTLTLLLSFWPQISNLLKNCFLKYGKVIISLSPDTYIMPYIIYFRKLFEGNQKFCCANKWKVSNLFIPLEIPLGHQKDSVLVHQSLCMRQQRNHLLCLSNSSCCPSPFQQNKISIYIYLDIYPNICIYYIIYIIILCYIWYIIYIIYYIY